MVFLEIICTFVPKFIYFSGNMSVEVRKITTKCGMYRFVKFGNDFYKNCENFCPSLILDELNTFNPKKNPAFDVCEYVLYMAYRDGKAVGRIAGIINHEANKKWGVKHVRFGWIDFIDDLEVSKALLDAVSAWGKSKGMDGLNGPVGFTDFDHQGLLIEGYDYLAPMASLYNYPYYVDLVQQLGFEKECDWLQYMMRADQDVEPRMKAIADRLMQRYKLRVADFDKLKKNEQTVKDFFRIYNESFDGRVYNFIPFTDAEIKAEMEQILPQLNSKLCCVLMDENDEVAAFGISIPCLSRAMQKAKGSMFPFGWYHVLKALRNYKNVDLMINGAAPKWQNTGISAVFHGVMSEQFKAAGSEWALANPQIETNLAVNVWDRYESKLWLRRRCWIKKIK